MFDTLNDALKLTGENLEGKYIEAVVTDNKDPLNKSRIQVVVPNLFSEEDERPWIGPFKWSPFGFGPSWGFYGSPAVGSTVIILFQSGNRQYPVYIAGLHKVANSNFPSGTSWGFQDPAGNIVKFDLETKAAEIVFAAGASITVGTDGFMTFKAKGFKFLGDTDTEGSLTNNGVNVGSTHTHGGVAAGGSHTSTPD